MSHGRKVYTQVMDIYTKARQECRFGFDDTAKFWGGPVLRDLRTQSWPIYEKKSSKTSSRTATSVSKNFRVPYRFLHGSVSWHAYSFLRHYFSQLFQLASRIFAQTEPEYFSLLNLIYFPFRLSLNVFFNFYTFPSVVVEKCVIVFWTKLPLRQLIGQWYSRCGKVAVSLSLERKWKERRVLYPWLGEWRINVERLLTWGKASWWSSPRWITIVGSYEQKSAEAPRSQDSHTHIYVYTLKSPL